MIGALTGRQYKTASGRASYVISNAGAEYVFTLVEVLQHCFGFHKVSLPRVGLSEVSLQCRRETEGGADGVTLMVGWDNWSGCYVMSLRPEDDPLVEEIGRYLDDRAT